MDWEKEIAEKEAKYRCHLELSRALWTQLKMTLARAPVEVREQPELRRLNENLGVVWEDRGV